MLTVPVLDPCTLLAKVALHEVQAALKTSTKALCRNLKDNPNVAENMAKMTSERVALQSLLTRALGDLEAHAWVTGLADLVASEEKADVAMRETIERERQAS